MQHQPIGVFDSGYGGLTVLKEIVASLPQYDYVYLGDNLRAPYGTRAFDVVYNFTLQAIEWFFKQGCHLVILACNTASAKALRTIQQKNLPVLAPYKRVLGVIRPTAEVIGEYTTTNQVGIFGTQGTVQSNSYVLEIEKFYPAVTVHQQACPGWVQLVEGNLISSPQAKIEVEQCVKQLLNQHNNIDAILLACTHYPLLKPVIEQFISPNIKLIAQGSIVARSLKAYLNRHPNIAEHCSKGGTQQFFTTGSPQSFDEHAATFYGKAVESKYTMLGPT